MFTLEPVKGRYINSTLDLASLLSSGNISDSYFTSASNIAKVLVKLKSTSGNQEVLVPFSVPATYDGSQPLTGTSYVSPSARDEFTLAWILFVDNQEGMFTLKASQMVDVTDFNVTFTSVESGPAPSSTPTELVNPFVTPGSYENVTVDSLGRVIGGINHTTLSGYGITDAVKNEGGVVSIEAGTNVERLAIFSPSEGMLFLATDTNSIYLFKSGIWVPLSTPLSSQLNAEISARESADASLTSSLSNEVSARMSADSALDSRVSILETNSATKSYVDSQKTLLQAQLDNIVSNTDPAALDSLSELLSAFQAADSNLQGAITALGTSASSALGQEVSRATAAETALETSISNLENEISSQYVDLNSTQIVTNKTLDADNNTISNLKNGNISDDANIALSKLAPLSASKVVVTGSDGKMSAASVTSSEVSYLSGVSSGIQTQLNAKASVSALNNEAAARDLGDTTTLNSAKSYTDSQIAANVSHLIGAGAYDAVVSSAADVTAGKATHSSIQSAINDLSSGQNILVMSGSYSENLTINKAVCIEGKGNSSIVIGSVTIGTNYSSLSKMRVTGNITISANSDHNNVSVVWVSSTSVVTNNGNKNYLVAIDD